MTKRITIEVDEEIFSALQTKAVPFVDTPNDVLRRLLLEKGNTRPKEVPTMAPSAPNDSPKDADAFARRLVEHQFGSGFRRRSGYQLMFESADTLVYVQNFNKKSDHLWYRINKKPLLELQNRNKKSWLCFTNPAENYAFVIPVEDVQRRIEQTGYKRDYLEVNINPAERRWAELEWKIESYFKSVPA